MSSEQSGENWFERHLNWTWILGWFTLEFVGGMILVIVANIYNMSEVTIPLFFVIGFISIISASIYVLRKKSRNLFWLLLVTFGSPLWLANHRKGDVDHPFIM